MHQRLSASFALALPIALGLGSCAQLSFSTKDEHLNQVDELLDRVEQVQAEALVSQSKAHAAYASLESLVTPEFDGDALAAYAELSKRIQECEEQGKKLSGAHAPLKASANDVFERWTANLESFGNTRLRQQSQERLEDTRTRCAAIQSALVSLQLSYDAFVADLADHALFLEQDFNSESVALIATEVAALSVRSQELDRRVETCVAACKAYLESTALRGQLEQPAPQARATPRETEKPAGSTLKRRQRTGTTPAPATEPEPATTETTPEATTAPTGGTPPAPNKP